MEIVTQSPLSRYLELRTFKRIINSQNLEGVRVPHTRMVTQPNKLFIEKMPPICPRLNQLETICDIYKSIDRKKLLQSMIDFVTLLEQYNETGKAIMDHHTDNIAIHVHPQTGDIQFWIFDPGLNQSVTDLPEQAQDAPEFFTSNGVFDSDSLGLLIWHMYYPGQHIPPIGKVPPDDPHPPRNLETYLRKLNKDKNPSSYTDLINAIKQDSEALS